MEQTCGGTLIRMAEMGYRTGVLDLTAGDMGSRGTPEIRLKESDAAGCHMLLAWRGNMRLPDARLENTVSVRMSMAVEIRESAAARGDSAVLGSAPSGSLSRRPKSASKPAFSRA